MRTGGRRSWRPLWQAGSEGTALHRASSSATSSPLAALLASRTISGGSSIISRRVAIRSCDGSASGLLRPLVRPAWTWPTHCKAGCFSSSTTTSAPRRPASFASFQMSSSSSSSSALRLQQLVCQPPRRAYASGGPSSSPSGGTGGARGRGSGGTGNNNNKKEDWQQKNKNVGFILTTLILGGITLSYASVPLYQRFCQITGYGGTTRRIDLEEAKKTGSPDRWRKRTDRPLTIKFYSNTNSNIPWVFYPLQNEVRLVPGESTLAFYRAENPSPDDIVGIASYNVVPAKAGIYFQKIQCFCFEEQLLPGKKGVDMPVYFVIDPDFADDPNMHDVEVISLFYTFFRAKDFDELNAKAYDEAQQQQQQPPQAQQPQKPAEVQA